MKLPHITLAALLPLAPVALFSTQELAFAPAEESEHQKTFSTIGSFQTADGSVTVSIEPEAFPIEIQIDWEQEVTITDRYQSVAEGRPTRYAREFESIKYEGDSTLSIDDPDEPVEIEQSPVGESALEGATILFKWDDEDESYSRTSEDEDLDDDLLAGIAEPMDFRTLLPDSTVEVGDSWEPNSLALSNYLKPGGDLSLKMNVGCLLYTSPSPRDLSTSRMPSSA